MPLFLNDDQYEIMLILAAAEAPRICPPRDSWSFLFCKYPRKVQVMPHAGILLHSVYSNAQIPS